MALDDFMDMVGPRKVRVKRAGVALFNSRWPGSKLRPERAYWFEFDEDGDLVDTDCPEHDDGPEVWVLSSDCRAWLLEDDVPEWLEGVAQ